MSRSLFILIIVLALGIVVYLWRDPSPAQGDKIASPDVRVKTLPPPGPVAPPVTLLPIAADVVLNDASRSPEDDLMTIEMLLSDFQKHFGGNPVGENEEIVAALRGKNPKGLSYLPASGNFLNSSGQMIDRWGTPYFFHQLSAKQSEIHSAGPDRVMNTDDDLVR